MDSYCKTSNTSPTLAGIKTVAHSDVVGASPVGAAPTTSSFSIYYLASIYSIKTTARRDEKYLSFGIWCILYLRFDGYLSSFNLDQEILWLPPQPDLNVNSAPMSSMGNRSALEVGNVSR